MKIKYSILTILIFSFSNINLKAQNNSYGFTVNYGISKIGTEYSHPEYFPQISKINPSGNFGIFYERKINNIFSFGAEFLLVEIRGRFIVDKEKTISAHTDQSTEEKIFSSKLKIYSNHLSMPIYFKIQKERLGIKLGIQPMYLIFLKGKFETWGTIDNEPFATANENPNILSDKLDIGPKFGLDYKLNNYIKIRFDTYLGLIDWTIDYPYEIWKNRQVSLGINFDFANIK